MASVGFDPRELVAALSDARIDYILIGGFAVGAHGHVRATKDLDIEPSAQLANLERLATVLRQLEATLFGTGDFKDDEFPFDPLDPRQLVRSAQIDLSGEGRPLSVLSGFICDCR